MHHTYRGYAHTFMTAQIISELPGDLATPSRGIVLDLYCLGIYTNKTCTVVGVVVPLSPLGDWFASEIGTHPLRKASI